MKHNSAVQKKWSLFLFNIYSNSYETVNEIAKQYTTDAKYFSDGNLQIPNGIDLFLNDVPTIFSSVLNSDDLKTIDYISNRKNRLTTNPEYNILLGTTYINEMLIKFKNALPLALAAYNAGPNRVKIWIKRYGDPRKKEISYVNWIESIPITETRFYVQKVLSNLRIYQKKYNLSLYN